jgi:hypothetical protein
MRAAALALILIVLAGGGVAQTPPLAPPADETPAPTLPDSLMFGPSELADIEKARKRQPGSRPSVEAAAEAVAAPVAAAPNIHLSALMYLGANRWTAWINGQQYGPGSATETIRVLAAAPNHVDLELEMHDRPPLRVRLSPNQTYLAAEGRVIEGIPP